MKSIKTVNVKKTGIALIPFFLLLFLSFCSAPCYLEQTFTNVNNVRNKTLLLIDNSKDDFNNHKVEIESNGQLIDNAIITNNTRKGSKEIGNIWNQLKNKDNNGIYDRFINDWKKSNKLPDKYINSAKTQVNKVLDQIIETENKIKTIRKPCK
jgi:hypothetical protein